MTGTPGAALSNRQRKILVKKIRADKGADPIPEVYVPPKVDGETEIRVTGKTGKATKLRLSRLEYLQNRGVINGRQLTAGLWIADKWQGYFAPSSSSGIEDQAPGSIPGDPLARWARGQRVKDRHGRARTPPPTFRPRKPAEPRRAHDGFSYTRLENLQAWIRARRLIDHLSPFDRKLLIYVCVEGHTLTDAARLSLGSAERAGKAERLHRRALQSLWRSLDAIADEIEPDISEINMQDEEVEYAEAG